MLPFALLVVIAPLAHAQVEREYRVKAVFLYRFAQFVEWPKDAAAPDVPFRICVLGTNPFGTALDDAVRGEQVRGRRVVARHVARAVDARSCQVVFISQSETPRLPAVLAELRGSSALTVGEIDRFAELGGMVNFRILKGKIHLEINVRAAREAGLTISSRLLKLATLVLPKKGPGG